MAHVDRWENRYSCSLYILGTASRRTKKWRWSSKFRRRGHGPVFTPDTEYNTLAPVGFSFVKSFTFSFFGAFESLVPPLPTRENRNHRQNESFQKLNRTPDLKRRDFYEY